MTRCQHEDMDNIQPRFPANHSIKVHFENQVNRSPQTNCGQPRRGRLHHKSIFCSRDPARNCCCADVRCQGGDKIYRGNLIWTTLGNHMFMVLALWVDLRTKLCLRHVLDCVLRHGSCLRSTVWWTCHKT